VLFFVSMGMLFDPMTLVREPWPLLGALAVVVIGKSLAAVAIMRIFKQPPDSTMLIAASLAQIGEFSFILAGVGVALGLAAGGRPRPDPWRGHPVDRAEPARLPRVRALRAQAAARAPCSVPQTLAAARRAIIVGFGRVGSRIGKPARTARKIDYSVVEEREEVIERLLEQGIPTITGNGASIDTLKARRCRIALTLIYITVPDGFEAGRIVEIARQQNPAIRILARSHNPTPRPNTWPASAPTSSSRARKKSRRR
jgi:CPA2 family monovalent cation:H+ antiporter-2